MNYSMPVVVDNLSLYLAEIKRFPVLSPEEEHECAVRFYEKKDLEAAHKLITSNLRFVVKIAGEYRAYGMKMLDLIQEGNVADDGGAQVQSAQGLSSHFLCRLVDPRLYPESHHLCLEPLEDRHHPSAKEAVL